MPYKHQINIDQALQDIPEDGMVKPRWLKQHFKFTSNNMATYKSRENFKKSDNGDFCLKEVCQFILGNSRGQSREDRRVLAVKILQHLSGEVIHTPKATPLRKSISTKRAVRPVEDEEEFEHEAPPTPVLRFKNSDEGLEASLSRTRQMEQHVSMQAQEIAGDPTILAIHLKTWRDIQDLLRKHESECLIILEKQKHLIPKEEVYEYFNKKINPTVAKLRALPVKIIDKLMDQDDRTKAVGILEKEIDKALEEISQNAG